MDDFRQLRHLVAIMDHRTVTEAADNLGITRSALSQSIRRMEDVYGVALFERVKRRVQPTVYAELLVQAARRSLDIFEDTHREMQLVRNMDSGTVTIGCDPTISELLLPQTLAEIIRLHPGATFAIETGFWSKQIDALRDGAIDIYLGIQPDGEIAEFEVHEITLPSVVVYCRRGHPLTRHPNPTMKDVMGFPIVGPPMPNWFSNTIDEEAGHSLPVSARSEHTVRANDGGAMREIVRRSDTVSGGFRPMIDGDFRGSPLAILPITTNPFARPIPGVIVRRRDRILPLTRHVIATITDLAASLVRAEQESEPLARS